MCGVWCAWACFVAGQALKLLKQTVFSLQPKNAASVASMDKSLSLLLQELLEFVAASAVAPAAAAADAGADADLAQVPVADAVL